MRSLRPLLAVVLLLLQVAPAVGAGVCWYHAATRAEPCDMPMQGATQGNDWSHSSRSQDCAQMTVCAPAAPAVLQKTVQFFGFTQPSRSSFSTPPGFLAGDPIAPPQPPPIA